MRHKCALILAVKVKKSAKYEQKKPFAISKASQFGDYTLLFF